MAPEIPTSRKRSETWGTPGLLGEIPGSDRDFCHCAGTRPGVSFSGTTQVGLKRKSAPHIFRALRGGLMPLSKLREFLDSHNIKYLVISHSLAYTAQGIAALAHVSGKKLAKTVIVKIDGTLAMAVVPASFHVNLELLRAVAGARAVEIASELEFQDAFPDCETGAMPPFGNLYDMAVYADSSLAEEEEITLSAGP